MNLLNKPHGNSPPYLPRSLHSWLEHYPPDVPAMLNYSDKPVSYLMEEAAQRFPDRPACTLFGQATTYAELSEKSRRFAQSLHRFGAGPGRRVGLLLPNIPEYLVALQATWLTGATALQLSPLMVPEEIETWLRRTDCHIVVTLDLLAPSVMGALKGDGPLEHLIVASLTGHMTTWKSWLYWAERIRRKGPMRLKETDDFHPFENLLPPVEKELNPCIRSCEDVAVLAPTGGTTDSPKAVMLTHRNLIANAVQLRWWSRQPDGTAGVLGVLPLFHAYGLSVCCLSSLAMGATLHMHPRFEARAVLDILGREKVNMVPAVPAMLNALNAVLEKKPRDLSNVHSVISGASALSKTTSEAFAKFGAKYVVEGYGLSEAGPVTHCNPLSESARIGSIGLPFPDTEARVMDEKTGTKEIPTGEPGELIIRGPQVMKGYFDNPEETSRALRDGWLYTGDIATRDADGFFKIVDRKKDIIKTSGFLVFPAEVEEVLANYPDISEAAVVGEPDEERGELVTALVVPANGAIDLPSVKKYCTEHLSKHKRPHRIEIVKELPKNFLGKVQRRKVREGRAESVG